jgi:hypothetical protein
MDHQKTFIKCFEAFGPKHNRCQVIADFALFGTAALHNAVAFSRELEDDYLRAAKRYDRDELNRHAELLATVVKGLEACGEDFLGQVFMALELGNDRAGQFFTPWHVSKMMAQISHGEALPHLTEEFVTLSEPACGAGGMILAFAEVMREAGHNPQRQLWVQAWDIDPLPARLCYIQLALLHIPGEIVIGDTLRYEAREVLRTPAHYLDFWDDKLRRRYTSESTEAPPAIEPHAMAIMPQTPENAVTAALAVDQQFMFDF